MVTDFRRLAAAVGRKDRGERVLQDLSNTLARAKTKLRSKAGQRVAIATPGGTSSAPAIRMFSQNSQTADVVRRLGLQGRLDRRTRATASRRSASRRSAA